MINIEEIAAVGYKKTYGIPLSCDAYPARAIEFAGLIARRVMQECIKEIGVVPCLAPDTDIVKEKITSRLRIIASEIPQ